MSFEIDPREVLTHLNHLGYKNINVLQLKEFIRDLKKLLKYEARHGMVSNILLDTQMTTNESGRIGDGDIFTHLYNQATISSKGKQVQPKQKEIVLKISKPKVTKYCHAHCKHVDDFKSNDWEPAQASDSETALKSVPPAPPNSEIKLCSKLKENVPPSSREFIKVYQPKRTKSDPVSLYHKYKDIWQKTSIPGTKSRDELRWSIREKMLSGPKVKPPAKPTKKVEAWR